MPVKPDRAQESLRKALDLAAIHYDNVVVFGNRFDPTDGTTYSSVVERGNAFAIQGHVVEWLDFVTNGGGGCDPDCPCGQGDMDDDEMPVDDADDDTVGNR